MLVFKKRCSGTALVMYRRKLRLGEGKVTQQVRSPESPVQAEEMRGQVASGGRGRPFPASSPSQALDSYLRAWTDGSDQSLTPLYSPSLEGPARAPGTPQEGTSLPPQPASCPFPGSNWTADPRENQHLGLPSTARRPRRGGTERRGPREAASRGPGRGGEEGWKAVVREREAGRKTEMVRRGETEKWTETARRRGEGLRERDAQIKGEAARLRKEEGGRGREGWRQ